MLESFFVLFFFVIGPEVSAGHRDSATPHQLAVRTLNLGVKEINKRSHTHLLNILQLS